MVENQLETLTVVKVGGGVLEDLVSLAGFLDRFVAIPGLKILVHGGGRVATKLSEQLNIKSKMVEGRRITDADTIDIVTMVYGGLINKKTVAALQARGCNAGGFTGADMNLINASKRPVIDVDYGFVGDVTQVNHQLLAILLKSGITPVIAPLTHDGNGQLLNTNADTIASEISGAMSDLYAVSLVFCFEKPGVLSDPNNYNSLIPELTAVSYQSFKEQGIIHSGMIPKIDNSFDALQKGVQQVIITSASTLDVNAGTRISL
ncbi:MAG: acetylglutamate kinase [Lentimicrobiaceae bacterium]|jgi:acetylglutamate kinase